MFRSNVFVVHFISTWAKFENKVGTTYAHKTETYWGLPSANSYLRQSFHHFCFAKVEEYVKTHVSTLHKCRQSYSSPTSIGTLILPYWQFLTKGKAKYSQYHESNGSIPLHYNSNMPRSFIPMACGTKSFSYPLLWRRVERKGQEIISIPKSVACLAKSCKTPD